MALAHCRAIPQSFNVCGNKLLRLIDSPERDPEASGQQAQSAPRYTDRINDAINGEAYFPVHFFQPWPAHFGAWIGLVGGPGAGGMWRS
ncbi:hypothetical protein NBRC116588_03610 [Pyruvatibacter sp. HU-CL02332]